MAKSRPTIMKRQRELARQEKRRDKAARRSVRSTTDGDDRPEGADDDYDPDIAHIVHGPQPVPWADELEDEENEENKDGETGETSETGEG
jgi:hypothetical protein